MIIKRKYFSFLSNLFSGGNVEKMSKKSAEEFRKEFDKWTKVNNDAIKEIKTVLPTNINIPGDLQVYLSFIYENYHNETLNLIDKDGKCKKTVLGWNQIKKKTERYYKTFKPNKNKALIFLAAETHDKPSFNSGEHWYCYFPQADGIWLFDVAWGGYSQGIFGLGARDGRLLSSIKLMLL